MKTERIKDLLEEAVTADWKRANAIQVELARATYAGSGGERDLHAAAGVLALIESLYVGLRRTDRAKLPDMLPVFVLACGDRDGRSYIAAIDA